MKAKLKRLLVGIGSSLFAIIGFVVFGWAIVAFGLFNLILVTLLEVIVLANHKIRRSVRMMNTTGHSRLAFDYKVFKIQNGSPRLTAIEGKISVNH